MASASSHQAGGAILYYLLGYSFTTLGAFAIVIALERAGEARDRIADFRGLARTHPGLAAASRTAVFCAIFKGRYKSRFLTHAVAINEPVKGSTFPHVAFLSSLGDGTRDS